MGVTAPMGLHRTAKGWEVFSDADGYVTGRAQFSDDRTRRYVLIRRWKHALDPIEQGNPNDRLPLTWVMLNPSTAGADTDDATIRKCVGYATRWGYGGIRVLNLFDLISTDPAALKSDPLPCSPRNAEVWAEWLRPWQGTEWSSLELRPDVVVGWGDGADVPVAGHPGVLLDRDRWAAEFFEKSGIEPMCLGTTRRGHPLHPGRTPYDLPRVPWKVR